MGTFGSYDAETGAHAGSAGVGPVRCCCCCCVCVCVCACACACVCVSVSVCVDMGVAVALPCCRRLGPVVGRGEEDEGDEGAQGPAP